MGFTPKSSKLEGIFSNPFSRGLNRKFPWVDPQIDPQVFVLKRKDLYGQVLQCSNSQVQKNNIPLLGGGWTNPLEKYLSKLDHFPR